MRTISSSEPVARKNYGCDASVWLTEGVIYSGDFSYYNFTFAEKRAIVRARKNGWRILKGEKHSQATIIGCDNEILSWRAITEIHDICLRHELYEHDVC